MPFNIKDKFKSCVHIFFCECIFIVFASKQNNVFFASGMNQRNGTDVDAANAMKAFAKLGYKVKVYNDQTVEQLKQVLLAGKNIHIHPLPFSHQLVSKINWMLCMFLFSVSKEDHSSSASIVCVLLSHGDEGVFFGTDGSVELKYLTSLFRGDRVKSLVGKPKLFFIQVF